MNQPQTCRPEVAARRSRRVPPQPLTAQEQHRYAPYFEPELLASVRILDGHVPFWLRPDMCGVTLGRRIYFRLGACDRHSPGGIELLAHELAHVQQFSRGMTLRSYLWASRRGYWRNPFEVEARAVGARVRAAVCGDRFAVDQSVQLSTAHCPGHLGQINQDGCLTMTRG